MGTIELSSSLVVVKHLDQLWMDLVYPKELDMRTKDWQQWITSGRQAATRTKQLMQEEKVAERDLILYCQKMAPKDALGRRHKPLLRIRGPISEALRTCQTRAERLVATIRQQKNTEMQMLNGGTVAHKIAKEAILRLDKALDVAKDAHWWVTWATKVMAQDGIEIDHAETGLFIASVEGQMQGAKVSARSAVPWAKKVVEKRIRKAETMQRAYAQRAEAAAKRREKARGVLTFSIGDKLGGLN